MLKKLFLFVSVLISHYAFGQIFPEAKGFGSQWTFTDNYEVRIVTNLNNSGAGSLRNAVESSSTYDGVIVVFNGLSGNIRLSSVINFEDRDHQLYIAGQTSKNGIIIEGSDYNGALLRFVGDRRLVDGVIVRGLTLLRGPAVVNDAGNGDCVSIGGNVKNIMFDHCTFAWSTDELFQIYGGGENITLQNCMFAEPLKISTHPQYLEHSTSILLGESRSSPYLVNKISIYHNLFIHSNSRNPVMYTIGEQVEVVSNISFNPGSHAIQLESPSSVKPKYFNLINNHQIDGVDTSPFFHGSMSARSSDTFNKLYLRGNINYWRPTQADPEWNAILEYGTQNTLSTVQQTLTPYNYPLKDVASNTTQELKNSLYENIGSFSRNTYEDRVLNLFMTETGAQIDHQSEVGGFPTIAAGTIIIDPDNDGIPNSEEATWGSDTFGYVNDLALGGGNNTVNANAGPNVSICSGESTTLTASGGSTYLWSTGATTNSITVSPNATQTYSVTVSDSNGNSDSDDVIVTVNSTTADAGTDVTIEEGNNTTLTASGGGNYLWSTGATTESISVSPLSTQTYSVIVTLNGCEDTDEVIVTVNPSTSVTANAGQDVSVCSGESTTLTASGGSNYLWNTGATTNSITVSPNSTQTYTVTVSDSNGNSDSDDVIVTVNNVTANAGADVTIDEGQSTTLNASGGDTYLWSNGATNQSITVSPLSTQVYSVTVTLNGCDDTDQVNVTVNPSVGSVTANAGQDVSICSGESTTLTATGGTTYLWNTGATTNSITVNPNSTQTYIVTASDANGNSDSDDVIVTVNSVTANAGVDVTIDEGQSTTLNASGGGTYLWSTGATSQSITVSPSSDQTYSVTVSLNGCEDTDDVNVTVNPSSVSVTANAGEDVSICSGESTTLTASGGSTYLWNTGATTNSITVSPNSTQTYTVTASDANGNSDSDDVIVTVNSVNANAGVDVTIEEGESTTLNANGGDTYLWSTGATSQSITVSPSSNQTYSVTVSLNGCEDTDEVNVTVNTNTGPVIANAGEDVTICIEENVILTASGGTSYLWNTGETTKSITVSPTTTTIYSVTVSNENSIDVDEVTVVVDETCSGISYRLNVKQTKFYPNPTKDVLNIELLNFSNESAISIFDLNGRIIYTETLDNYSPVKIFRHQINLSKFGKGIYFVNLSNSDYRETKKILVF